MVRNSESCSVKSSKDGGFSFHGDHDNVVTVEGSREAYRALKAADFIASFSQPLV